MYACADVSCANTTCTGGRKCTDTYQNVSCGGNTFTVAVGFCICPVGGCPDSGDPRTCFAAGTKVNMDGGDKKNIEDIKVGDKVVSQSETDVRSVSTVTKLDQPIREHMCRLGFTNGGTVKLTEEHPLMTHDGWKALDPNKTKDENPDLIVGKLEKGDVVVREDGVRAELQNISCWSEKVPAYNLILDGNARTYFADGFLAHNKGGCNWSQVNCPAGGTKNGKVVSVSCGSSYCPAPGTAQAVTGCCGDGNYDEDGWYCGNQQVTTYECCPAGTTPKETLVNGGTYTRDNGCSSSTTCNDGDDLYIGSWGSSTVCSRTCDYPDPETGSCRGQEKINTYGSITQCQERHIEYSCVPTCAAGVAPTLALPDEGGVFAGPSGAASINFDWNAVANWGTESASGSRTYTLCVGTNNTDPCSGGSTYTTSGVTPATAYTASVPFGTKYWGVKAANSCSYTSPLSAVRSVCVEGFNVANTDYVSNWSACDANHKHTRTCREDCGTDNCAVTPLEEDCLGAVRGTLFNASDYGSCPAFDPATGYLTGLPAGVGAASRNFGFAGTWPPLSTAVTDSSGNYSIQVYAPGSYNYDFSPLSDIYVTGGGPKLTCFSAVASVPSNPVNCQTQPCSLVNDMSFGFWKIYGGWWQAVGGSVHGDTGVRSEIPASLATEMSLILPDTTAGNRLGFLSYGTARADDMLGTNPEAKVSSELWEKESKYSGQIYDWSFYNSRFNLFTKTSWSDGESVVYDDQGKGYQIFQSDGSINSFDLSPTGTQKVIFHINGNVRVTGDIVVPDGAFLAVIAKGTITFDPSVSQADGWYVAESIAIPCLDVDSNGCDKTDSQFAGNGSFIAWNGFSLGRTRNLTNNVAPSEKFTYRQDLYRNAPAAMKVYTKLYKPFVP